jgi:REP element-mobilizing transposase RayT
MPRPLRIEFPGAMYHVTARGNNRARIVWEDEDRRLFLTALTGVVSGYGLELHAYCLMSNHYHLALRTPLANLGRAMQALNSAFAVAMNRRHVRVGHLFQGRYHASLIEHEPYLLELVRYVVLNPVRAGLAASPERWRWSSHLATAGLARPPSCLTTAWTLGHFSEDPERARARYRDFVLDGIRAEG